MVARMMRWPPWPPLHSKNFQVKLVLLRLEAPLGLQGPDDLAGGAPTGQEANAEAAAPEKKKVLTAEVRWKGPKTTLTSLRRPSIKRNCTRALEALDLRPLKEGEEGEEGFLSGVVSVVEWNEEFRSVCCLTSHKHNAYHPWEVAFSVLDSNGGPSRRKMFVIGSASLNLSEFISLSLMEMRPAEESSDARSIVPVPLSPAPVDALHAERDELSALKAGLRKVKIFTELMSARRSKKACGEDEGSEGRCSARSEDGEHSSCPFDTDSPRRRTLTKATTTRRNTALGSRSATGRWPLQTTSGVVLLADEDQRGEEHPPWRKRKLSFRSPKARGEPLLYGEEGGDDIDWPPAQLLTNPSFFFSSAAGAGAAGAAGQQVLCGSEFGDEGFAVGSWGEKECSLRPSTAERAGRRRERLHRPGGGGRRLLQANGDAIPIKSQFDSLIREGSREWRNLCEHEAYRQRFPDRHFDLDTVLHAKIRPLSVAAGKSFVGFFHPEGTTTTTTTTGSDGGGGADGSGFDFLQEAMSFDSIWDEVSRAATEQRSRPAPGGGSPQQQVYIVSWNDHFFVLKVEEAAYYIIDTLGERLHEGCNQAYILKFDDKPAAAGEAVVAQPETLQQAGGVAGAVEEEVAAETEEVEAEEEVVVCRGKESCKEYIKTPGRRPEGLMASTPIHHRLQIEFHFTEPSSPQRRRRSRPSRALPPCIAKRT
ncbi:unnamed protein product [Spirodela intermedia]|uniref:C2 NT-type domain-containing protein n=1 Tax=Spirodela intermedia TaxID=51605 RepID=A0A7I8IKN3_SPIIN|nr:unnamed protein product [Spirodela intermedia]CAA6658444.1 unnamed protein product [Spirodela intermedia]